MPHEERTSAADTDAVEVGGRRGAVKEEGTRGRVLMRGDYITFTEYFHGEGAIGVMSVMDNAGAPGLTFMGGFDVRVSLSWAVSTSFKMRMTS